MQVFNNAIRYKDSEKEKKCAFANDFDDLGGWYIIVGIDTDDKT